MSEPSSVLRPLILAVLFCAGASAVFAASPTPSQHRAAIAAEMMIEAGRLSVMLDQAEAAMKLRAQPTEEPVETPAQQQIYAVHELRAAVLRYNVMQFDACRSGLISGDLCAQPYLPDWLKEPPDVIPPPFVVVARVQDAMTHILPFWSAMCAKAVAQTHDDTFCAME